MKRAEWAGQAKNDLLRLYRWYRPYDAGVADRIADTIVTKCDWLAEFPATGSPIGGSRRKLIVAGTRHLIVYRPTPHGIRVVRIFHESQNWR